MKQELLRNAPISTQGNLNIEKVGILKIAIPCLDEQLNIIQFVEGRTAIYEESILACQREIKLIQEYRDCLISDAVTGKIDVSDVKIEDSSSQDTAGDLIEPEEIEESLELVGVADEDD